MWTIFVYDGGVGEAWWGKARAVLLGGPAEGVGQRGRVDEAASLLVEQLTQKPYVCLNHLNNEKYIRATQITKTNWHVFQDKGIRMCVDIGRS